MSAELASVYGLRVVGIRPHHRTRRRLTAVRVLRSDAAKWARVVARTRRMVARGRPVLIATRTVRASLAVSEALTTAGIDHQLLNAIQDAEEGEVIAAAGQAGRVTVATNMAGRGVDIRLGPGVAPAGGLHVILTELHEAGRIDRQAIGRAARQGDRGTYEIVLGWEDALIKVFGDRRARLRLGGILAFRRAQRRAEALHGRARLDLLRQDSRREQQMTFTGSIE